MKRLWWIAGVIGTFLSSWAVMSFACTNILVSKLVVSEEPAGYKLEVVIEIPLELKIAGRIHGFQRYVLENIEQFSPRALLFDVLFVKPEIVPPDVLETLGPDPALRRRVEQAYAEMDGRFAAALAKYDNVYASLQLVEQARPDLPDFYRERIRFNEQILKKWSLPAAPGTETMPFHSLEPVLNDFVRNLSPVVTNVPADDDGVTRFFPLYYSYLMSDRSERNLFTAVLAMVQRYYRVANTDIRLEPDRVVLQSARVPVLDPDSHRPVITLEDFSDIAARVDNPDPPPGHARNANLYNLLADQLLIGIQTPDRIPLFPLHLLRRADNRLEILEGWEIFAAARRAGSTKIRAVFYTRQDLTIKTPFTGLYPINYAGREKRYSLDPETGTAVPVTTIPTRSYGEVYELEPLPDIPELDRNRSIPPDYDLGPLETWFLRYCEDRAFAIYQDAGRELGDRIQDEHALGNYLNRHPDAGRYSYYYNFFQEYSAAPGHLLELAAAYPDFGREMGQDPAYFFSEQELVRSLLDVYRTRFQRYYNRFVFAGATALGLGDVRQTPCGPMTGISTIVSAFNTIITRNLLTRSVDIPGLDFKLLLALCLLCSFGYGLSSVRISSFLAFLLLCATLSGSFYLFTAHNLFLTTTPLLVANLLIFMAAIVYRVVVEQRDKRFLKSTFSSYLAPEIIDEMYKSKSMPTLGGEARSITAYFTDIQSFSTFSEKLTAQQLVELINEYLSAMTDILIAEGGTLDKYEGDAIIAFFGAPLTFPDHSLRACRVALAMQDRLLELRGKWARERTAPDAPDPNTRNIPSEEWQPGDKWPRIVHEMKMRIGINTGEIVVGNMGSAMRMNYTMMGDPVNLAARLEAAGKQYGVYILVSEDTLEQEITVETGQKQKVRDLVETRFIDRIVVVGRSEPVRVYELCALKGELGKRDQDLLRVFARGRDHYLAMNWDRAIARFAESQQLERVPDSPVTPSAVYIDRCRAYRKNPPVSGPDGTWDGVYRLSEK